MKSITKLMINEFKIMQLGFDFMGYRVEKQNSLSFHHLIVPRRKCNEKKIGNGYLFWNGAILNQLTSHDYLHLIENKDYDMFIAITNEMIKQNIKGYLDKDNLLKIKDILEQFEKEHCFDRSKKGDFIIKSEYIKEKAKII